MTAEDAMWTTSLPTSWPEPPQDMTVTTLLEIEACPRRWSLTNAEYPALWDGRGYPPQIQPAALGGTVVHSAVEGDRRRTRSSGVLDGRFCRSH